MIREQLEFAISQYLDGTLPDQDRAALEERLSNDAFAQRLLQEQLSLDRLIRQSMPLPQIKWENLAKNISAVVSQEAIGQADAQPANDDVLELALIQHMNDELPVEQRPALEMRLANDPAALKLAAQQRALDVLLKHAWPLPHVDFARLRQRISDRLDTVAAPSRYSIASWLIAAPRLAAAAIVLIGLGLALWLTLDRARPGAGTHPVASPLVIRSVESGKESAEDSQVMRIVSEGASDEPAGRLASAARDLGIVVDPGTVQIAQQSQGTQDPVPFWW